MSPYGLLIAIGRDIVAGRRADASPHRPHQQAGASLIFDTQRQRGAFLGVVLVVVVGSFSILNAKGEREADSRAAVAAENLAAKLRVVDPAALVFGDASKLIGPYRQIHHEGSTLRVSLQVDAWLASRCIVVTRTAEPAIDVRARIVDGRCT